MPRTSESRWFQAPSSVLTAVAAAAVAASRCEVWLSQRVVSRDRDGTCHHVPAGSARGGAKREQLMVQQQQQQPSIAAGRLAFVMQPRSVTSPGNCAASLELSRNRAAAVAVQGVSYDHRGISSDAGSRRPRRRHNGWSWTSSAAGPSTGGWFSTSRVGVVDGGGGGENGGGGGTGRSCIGREAVDVCALAAADRVPGQRGAGSLPPPPTPPPPLSRPLRSLPLEMRAEVEEEGGVVVGQEGGMVVEEGEVVVQGGGGVVMVQEGGVGEGQRGIEEEEDEILLKPERSSAEGEGIKRERVQSSARRQEAVGGVGLGGVVEAGAGGRETEWCTRAAEARACEEEPLLAEAFRQFEEKHPGATIVYLAHSGSRLYGTNTSESDVDIKGVFVPASPPAAPTTNQRRSRGGKKEALGLGSASAGQPTARRPRAPAAPYDEAFPVEETFWYSTSNSTAPNTVDDIDVELISLDRFLAQLMRGDIGGLETLFSMLVPKIYVLADPEIIPLILQERRWMVSSNVSCWTGFAHSHVARFRKVQQKSLNIARKARFKEQQRLEAFGKKDASAPTATSNLASTSTSESSLSPTSTSSTSDSTSTSTPNLGSTSSSTSTPSSTSTATLTSNPTPSSTSSSSSASSGAEASASVLAAGSSAGEEEQAMATKADGDQETAAAAAAAVTVAGRSSLGGVATGVVAAETGATRSDAAMGGSGSARASSRLGVLSRDGVEVGRREEVGGAGAGEGEEDEEGEEEQREKGLARKIKCGKLLAHARRSIMQAEELLSTGKITFPLKPLQVDELRRLKAMKVHVPKKVANIQTGARRLLVKGKNSPLPSAPSRLKLIALRKEALETLDRRRRREADGS